MGSFGLPGLRREPSALAQKARLTCDDGDCSELLNGIDRRIWGCDNGYYSKTNKAITYTLDEDTWVEGFRLVLDSDLDRVNHQRFIRQKLRLLARAVRFIPLTTYFSERKVEDYGSSVAHLFHFEVY